MKFILLLLLVNLALWGLYFTSQPVALINPLLSKSVNILTNANAGDEGNKTITLLTTGDVMLGRTINIQSVSTNNFTWPFANVAPMLNAADITFINLENPIPDHCPLSGTGFTFCSDSRSVQGLTLSGVDIANLANNHTTNYGQSGLAQTVALLTTHHIQVTGIHDPIYSQVQDTTFAFLGFNDTFTPLDTAYVTQAISSAKADIVVVAFHWGTEYTSTPTKRQIALAHAAIGAGADIIVGNHPHWPQTIEEYQGKYIYYSHGNFIFDQFWSKPTQQGIVIKTFIRDHQLAGYQVLPISITSPGVVTQP